MDDTEDGDSLIARAGRRLAASRHLLLVFGILLVLFVAVAGLPLWLAALGMFGCVGVAAMAPQRKRVVRDEVRRAHPDPAYLDTLIGVIPEPVMLLDGSGIILKANDDFVRFLGDARTGTSALLRFRNPELQAAIREALEGENVPPLEYADRGRIERWYDVTIIRLPDDVFGEAEYLLHFRDKSEARRIDRMRTDFIGNASHELRTPLASLKGFLETLAGPARNDDRARERFIPIMQQQADRMERLIDDLLSLSRFETSLGRSEYTDVDLSDILEHVRSALQPLAAQLGVTLDCQASLPDGTRLTVHGNRDELIQLFENLIENAIKYGAEGEEVSTSIEKKQEAGREVYKIHVSDKGPGIDAAHIPRLTERFYRVDVESSRDKQGTGLGLAIVKHILTRHDGRLQVASKKGQGSTFSVTLPAHDAE